MRDEPPERDGATAPSADDPIDEDVEQTQSDEDAEPTESDEDGDRAQRDADDDRTLTDEDADLTHTDEDADLTHTDEDADLTHTDEDGAVSMVDVGAKPDTARRAVARGAIALQPATVDAVRENDLEKGDALATARVGAIQAVKHTWETIPLCHQIPITGVDTEFALEDDRIVLEVAVETVSKTGCEMEAIQGVSTGLGVVWDVVKAAEKDADGQYPETRIEGIEVVEKTKRPLE